MKVNELIQFYPSKGLGKIEFSFDEDDIIEALGEADEIEEESFSDSESLVSLSYYDWGLDFFVEYIDDDKILSIHSDDMILADTHLASLEKDEMLKFIQKYHEENGIEFECEKAIEEDSDEECYFFDNIGLTIWYLNDIVTDICVQHPDDM